MKFLVSLLLIGFLGKLSSAKVMPRPAPPPFVDQLSHGTQDSVPRQKLNVAKYYAERDTSNPKDRELAQKEKDESEGSKETTEVKFMKEILDKELKQFQWKIACAKSDYPSGGMRFMLEKLESILEDAQSKDKTLQAKQCSKKKFDLIKILIRDGKLNEAGLKLWRIYAAELQKLEKYKLYAKKEYNLANDLMIVGSPGEPSNVAIFGANIKLYKEAVIAHVKNELPKDNKKINQIIESIDSSSEVDVKFRKMEEALYEFEGLLIYARNKIHNNKKVIPYSDPNRTKLEKLETQLTRAIENFDMPIKEKKSLLTNYEEIKRILE